MLKILKTAALVGLMTSTTLVNATEVIVTATGIIGSPVTMTIDKVPTLGTVTSGAGDCTYFVSPLDNNVVGSTNNGEDCRVLNGNFDVGSLTVNCTEGTEVSGRVELGNMVGLQSATVDLVASNRAPLLTSNFAGSTTIACNVLTAGSVDFYVGYTVGGGTMGSLLTLPISINMDY